MHLWVEGRVNHHLNIIASLTITLVRLLRVRTSNIIITMFISVRDIAIIKWCIGLMLRSFAISLGTLTYGYIWEISRWSTLLCIVGQTRFKTNAFDKIPTSPSATASGKPSTRTANCIARARLAYRDDTGNT
jgi:hypothetical protein